MRIKQVILIRKDLKMRRGKEIAQGSHASMDFMISRLREQPGEDCRKLELTRDEQKWIDEGMAKVCLRVDSEEMLVEYHSRALEAGLKSFMIRDSGRTEFGGVPTLTACAIGPAEVAEIDKITGDLVLY
jgi:PTH2 family peptidyl-tRNA hydrolase